MKIITINTNRKLMITDLVTLVMASSRYLWSHIKEPTVSLTVLLVSFSISGTALADWVAYNDAVYDSGTNSYIGSNVTEFGIGDGFTGSTSGELLDQATGDSTGITASFTQSGVVSWQSDSEFGGADTAEGTDANDTFGTFANMTGVIYYGDEQGWWVDLTFTNLDSSKRYTFATSASRNNSEYTDRYTQYTLSSTDAATNASTSGVNVIDNLNVYFDTGNNHDTGYVARWTDIDPGDDNTFTVRAKAHPSADDGNGIKAYSFDVFKLQEVSIPEEEDDFLLLLIPSITAGSN